MKAPVCAEVGLLRLFSQGEHLFSQDLLLLTGWEAVWSVLPLPPKLPPQGPQGRPG